MILGIGMDIIEINRIKEASNTRFMERIFTEGERHYLKMRNNNIYTIAGSFSAKEAVAKALGTGIGRVSWRDIEIVHDNDGKPYVKLHNMAKSHMDAIGGERVYISISHSREYAVAQAIIEG